MSPSPELPELHFNLVSLEPHISKNTLEHHYLGHHAGYTRQLNYAKQEAREQGHTWVDTVSVPDLLARIAKENEAKAKRRELAAAGASNAATKGELSDALARKLLHAAGGYINHALYFHLLDEPIKHAWKDPRGALGAKIDEVFGSLDAFKKNFTDVALGGLGSGWTWLVVTQDGK